MDRAEPFGRRLFRTMFGFVVNLKGVWRMSAPFLCIGLTLNNNGMKKGLSSVVLLLICTNLFSESVEVDGIFYELNTTDHAATVTKMTSGNVGYSGDIVIPEAITYRNRDFNVKSVGASAFSSCTGLTSVTIPNSVTSIGNYAFSGCKGLTALTFPNSVTSIGGYAFKNCTGLKSITIPNFVTSIGDGAFESCKGLTAVTIGNSVTSIGGYAFKDCTGLKSITIPNFVTSIGDGAFESCKGLTAVTIGNSVTSIGAQAFSSCTGLTSINIPNSVTKIGQNAFSGCTELISATIGNSVTSIGSFAFIDCTSLTSITIPNSVRSIGNRAFARCRSLTSVTIGNSVTSTGDFAFLECGGLTAVTIGKSVTSIGAGSFDGCRNIETVVSLNPTPPSGSFPSEVYLGTLYVPIGSESAYRNADGWKKFYEIIEGTPDDVNKTCSLSVSSSKGGSVSFLDKTVKSSSETISVETGTAVTFFISADDGYRLLSLMVNGKDVTAGIVDGKYTIEEINEATTITATFEDKSIRRAKMDTNGDGQVNSADVVAIYNYIITGE